MRMTNNKTGKPGRAKSTRPWGSWRKVENPRVKVLSIRVNPVERELILSYFKDTTAMREYLLKVTKGKKAKVNGTSKTNR